MAPSVKPIPEGFHSVTPYLVVSDAARAIEFYKRAFGAQEVMRMNTPQGKVFHAEIKIGDSMVMLGEPPPHGDLRSPETLHGSTVSMMLYLEDVDATFEQAVSAGAKAAQALTDMFWGDRHGRVVDPFGHSWSLSQHVEDVSPEEMARRSEAAAKAAQSASAS